jgi:hypothetical protein
MNTTKPKKTTKKETSTEVSSEISKTEEKSTDELTDTKPKDNAENKLITPSFESKEQANQASDVQESKKSKVKVIRDNFTFPESDYSRIFELKKQCLASGVHVKKSELLRAGLASLARLSLEDLLKAVEKVEKIQTGRPKKTRKLK